MESGVAQQILNCNTLRKLPNRFVVHINKVPIDLLEWPKPGAHGDPNNQRSLEDALLIANERRASGIGFSVPNSAVIIDFDHCVAPDGSISAWALAVLSKIPSTYVEFSPSGTGLHAFVEISPQAYMRVNGAPKVTSIAGGKVELLRDGFYATITGNRHPSYPDYMAEMNADDIDELLRRLQQLTRTYPSNITIKEIEINEQIYKAKEAQIKAWRESIMSGSSLHEPTFCLAWWSAYNDIPQFEAESMLYELYEQCATKDQRWRDRRKTIPIIVSRCYRNGPGFRQRAAAKRGSLDRMTQEHCANFIAEHHAGDFSFTENGWLNNNGRYYAKISNEQAMVRMMDLNKPDIEKFIAGADEKVKAHLAKERRAQQSSYFMGGMQKIAQGRMKQGINTFESEPHMLNVQNGIINLRDGSRIKHDHSFRFTNMVNVPYPDGLRPTPIFDKFLMDCCCGDRTLYDFIMRWLGYSITGEVIEQKFVVMYGAGANGKSTLMNLMREIFGEATLINVVGAEGAGRYYGALRAEAIIEQRNQSDVGNDIAALNKVRMVSCSEVGDRRVKDERVKALTGGDAIQVRYLYREYFNMVPVCKITMLTNHKPKIRGNDDAIWRRAIMIPFNANFANNGDPRMLNKLVTEAEGILYRLVQEAVAYYKDGLLEPTDAIKESLRTWRADVDAISRYIEDTLVKTDDEKDTILVADVYKEYTKWCSENNERVESSAKFSDEMERRNYEIVQRRDARKNRVRMFTGMKLAIDARSALEDEI